MTLLQVKSEQENNFYCSELNKLEKNFMSNKQLNNNKIKEFNKNLFSKKIINNEVLDSVPILKKLHNKWSIKIFEKKKEIDKFIRNMRSIEDAFMQIKEATGI